MPPKIELNKLKLILQSNGEYNPIYKDSTKLYKDLKVHADGDFPSDVIKKRRPSEGEEIFEYRKENYEPITKLPLSQVINCFGKIRRSADWMINFPDTKKFAKISDEETLEKYCNVNMPGFTSITNWAFGILLPQNLIDANAIVAVIPLNPIINNEFIQPVPILFNSDQVLYYDEMEKVCVLKSRVKYTPVNGEINQEKIYYIDDNVIIIYQQSKGGYTAISEIVNVTKRLPAFRISSESYKQYDGVSLNRSRLHAMVPFLNKAAAGDSDLEGSKVQHLFPLFWYFQNKECNHCQGTGKLPPQEGATHPAICNSCDNGNVKFSPFAHIQVDAASLDKQSNPIPPAGYIQKDTTILELQEKTVEKNNYKALCAMNMQFLSQTPLSISGDAKQVDREELNNTVYNTAEDLVYSIDKVISLINDWRNSYIIPDAKSRREILPNIPVPQSFDLLPEDYLMKEVSEARNAKVNPLLIATLEYQLAAKKFYNHPELASNIKLYFDLDPLPGINADEKMSLMGNKGITKVDYVISTYIASFIKRAIIENKDFESLEYKKKIEILTGYANEKISANDVAGNMIEDEKQKVLAEMAAAAAANG